MLDEEEHGSTFENIPKKKSASISAEMLSEADLEQEIGLKMQESSKIRELEQRLEDLKHAKMAHRELQVERNRITA